MINISLFTQKVDGKSHNILLGVDTYLLKEHGTTSIEVFFPEYQSSITGTKRNNKTGNPCLEIDALM